jgi:hypothetical protein
MNNPELIEKLKSLYSDNSKHSRYQNIPAFVRQELGYSETIDENWRGDTARYNYLLNQFDFTKEMVIGDIGANTGFFSLSLAHKYPNLKVYAYECNPKHVEHIEIIKDYFSLSNLFVEQEMLNLKNIDNLKHHDLIINFNVLHHAGVDYDRDIVNLDNFESYATAYLAKLREKTEKIIFQMGYNWGGNKQKPIIKLSNDLDKIDFTAKIFQKAGWKIDIIAIIKKNENNYYENIRKDIFEILVNSNDCHTEHLDILNDYINKLNLKVYSEFYRRPILVCKRDQSVD